FTRAANDIVWHGRVDLAGQLDEARGDAVLASDPGEVKRVDRNAVPAQPRPRIEGLEAERLRLGGFDHFPHVDAHGLENHLQLIHKCDVHGAISVFQDFASFRYAGAAYRDDAFNDRLIQRHGQFAADGVHTADDLRNVASRVDGVAGVFAFGAEGQEEIAAG